MRSQREHFFAVPLGSRGPAVALRSSLHAGGSGGEVLRSHGRPDRYLRIESKKPWLGDGRQLRRFLHVEEDVPGTFAAVFGEVGCFRLQLVQNALDGALQAASPSRGIPCFHGYRNLE